MFDQSHPPAAARRDRRSGAAIAPDPATPMLSAADTLGPHGPLAQSIGHFAPRAEQQAMATAVARAIQKGSTLIAEAGTGTGKTFAYLIPALQSGLRVLVSTGTRNLQDQLFHRDLPVVRDALGLSGRMALLKGRSNYLCLYRLDLAIMQGRLRSRTAAAELERVRVWSGRTRDGDIAEVANVPEDSAVWPLVTSTVDNCLGQECPAYGECHVLRARRRAQEADVVVINHHLLFADMALKEDGFGDLLPGADVFILDEAHQLPETASNFFGVSVSSRQIQELVRDTRDEHVREAGDLTELPGVLEKVDRAAQDARIALGEGSRRLPWLQAKGSAAFVTALQRLQSALDELGPWLEHAAQRGKGLENCWRRHQGIVERLRTVTADASAEQIQWLDVHRRSFTLHLTPMDIAASFQNHLRARPAAWIFTSATLTVGNRFSHFAQRLGLEEAETIQVDSPFDYGANALLYVPKQLPDPAAASYTDAVIDAAIPVIEACRGGVFVLFTSHRALQQAAARLHGRFPRPMFVQGQAPRAQLLEQFRDLGNALLLGTGSFWEGVDVRGPALSCVIIDKLPFASPGDPVLQARIDAMRAAGANPFMDYQLPAAVLALKQGVGRLIRDVDDRGVMVLCDPRLYSRPYGRLFRGSLPPMGNTRDLAGVLRFFETDAEHRANIEGERNAEPQA